MECSPPGSSASGILQARNTGVGCHALFQEIFLTQGSNRSPVALQADSLPLSYQGSPFGLYQPINDLVGALRGRRIQIDTCAVSWACLCDWKREWNRLSRFIQGLMEPPLGQKVGCFNWWFQQTHERMWGRQFPKDREVVIRRSRKRKGTLDRPPPQDEQENLGCLPGVPETVFLIRDVQNVCVLSKVKQEIHAAAHMLCYGSLGHRNIGLKAEIRQLKDRRHS